MLLQRTESGQITPFWDTQRTNQQEQLDLDVTSLKNYLAALNEGINDASVLDAKLIGVSNAAKELAKSDGFSAEKIKEFSDSQTAAITSTGRLSGSLNSLKGVAKAVGTAFLNMGIALVASLAIDLAIRAIDNWVNAANKAIEAARELSEEYEKTNDSLSKNKKTLDGISAEYVKLAKGVDSFGKNVSLTTEEYDRYHDVANQIADMFPKLVKGWDSEGNAILSVRDNLQELNQAYKDAVYTQNNEILSKGDTLVSGFAAAFDKNAAGKKIDIISEIIESNSDKDQIRRIIVDNINEINQILGDNKIYEIPNQLLIDLMSGGLDALTDLERNQLSELTDIVVENGNALVAYSEELESAINSSATGVRQLINAYLGNNSDYEKFSDQTKSLISTIITSLDSAELKGIKDRGIDFTTWTQGLVESFKNVDLSSAINAKSLFDADKLSLGEYQKAFDAFKKKIEGFAPEVQGALIETFSPNTDNLVSNIVEKLIDGWDKIKTLTADQLQIGADLDIAGKITWDSFYQKIIDAQTKEVQSIDAVSASIKPLTEMYDALNNALSEQAESGTMTYETYTKLIAANAEFASAIDTVDGQLRIDANRAYEVADAHTKLKQSLAEAATAAKKAEYDEVAKDLEKVNERLREMDELGYQNTLYDSLLDQKDALEAKLDGLDDELQKYQSITSQIKGMTSAYYQYLRAKQTPDQGEEYDQFKGAKEDLKKGLKTGKIGTDDFKSAVDLIFGGSSEGLTPEELRKRNKLAEQKYDRYFTDSPKGGTNFLKDLQKGGLVTKKGKEYILNEGVTGEQIAEELGISLDAVKAIIGELEEYGGKFDWSLLFGETKEEYEQEKQDKFDKPIEDLKTGVDKYVEAVDKEVERVENANKKLDTALGIKTEPTPSGGSAPKSSVESRREEGFETPSRGATTTTTPTLPLPTYVVTVNAQVGQTLSGTDLLIGSTVSEDGSVSYTVFANGQVGEALQQNDLILNLNEDGTYDVFVDGTPGKTIGADSIVIGASESGALSITANGEAGNVLSANDLIVGIDETTGQMYIITRAKTDAQIGKSDLVSDLNQDGELDVPINATVNSTVGKDSLVIGIDENGNYNVTVNGEVGQAIPKEGLLLNINSDGTYDVVVNGTPGNTVSKDNIVIGRNDDGTYSVKVNGEAGDTIKKADVVLGLTEDEWSVKTNAKVGNTVNKDDIVKDTSEDGNYVIDVDANTNPALAKVSELQKEAEKPAEKVVTVTTVYESRGGGGGHGAFTGDTGQTGTFGSGSTSGSGGGRKKSTTSTESKPVDLINVDNIEEAQVQLNIFQVIWQKILSLFGQNAPIVDTVISPSAQAEITNAQGGLDGIASTEIPDKTISIDDTDARADVKEFEERADDTVEKKINVTYTGETGKFAKGTKNAPKGVVLVDEEGAELIEHTDGTYEIGTNQGPRFTVVDKGAVIHDAADTKRILRRGISPVSSVGNRYADGSPGSIYWDPPSSGSGKKNTSSSKKNTAKKVNWKKYVDKIFDWIEIRLKRLQTVTNQWMREIERAVGYIEKNKAIDEAIKSQQEQIDALTQAYDRYMEQAEQIRKKTKLKDSTIEKIQNGTIDIASYSKKDQERIKAYMEWWEKAQAVKDELEDLKDEQQRLAQQKLDNIIRYYDNLRDRIEQIKEAAQSAIDLKVAQGREVTEADYKPLIESQEQAIETLREQLAVVSAEFKKQVAEGTLVEGSDAWYEYVKQITELDLAIVNAKIDLEELQDAANSIVVTNLMNLLKALQATQSSIEQTLDLIEAQGRLATTDTFKQLIANGMEQIANLEQQNAALRAQQEGLDVLSDKYQEIQEQIDGNLDTINSIKVSQEQWNDAMLDLRIDELTRLKDELDKTNDQYQRSLDLQKAIEDLERAKSQRTIRILKDNKFVYEADTQAVAEKQRALDEKYHNEDLAKIDEVIEAIEGMKATSNVYAALGLTPTSLTELYPNASINDIIAAVNASVYSGVALSELAQSTDRFPTVQNSTVNSPTVIVSPGAIQVSGSGDPEAIANYTIQKLSEEMSTIMTQDMYGK